MICHVTQIHPRDAWCAAFHVRAYLTLCDRVIVAVDSDRDGFGDRLRAISDRVAVVYFADDGKLPADRINEHGMKYHEDLIRQASLDVAMTFNPSLLVFGDADEIPTPDAAEFVRSIASRPNTGERWYVHWVNLWLDFAHAIGGQSPWSFQNDRGNKKCFAMQPATPRTPEMTYQNAQHCGMEPGRNNGGAAPTGPGRYLVDSPKLLHLKYGWTGHADRPESKLTRHQPDVMLKGGQVVDVPAEWLWPGLGELQCVR